MYKFNPLKDPIILVALSFLSIHIGASWLHYSLIKNIPVDHFKVTLPFVVALVFSIQAKWSSQPNATT